MRWVLWLLLLFGVAVVAALTLGDNAGLVSMAWGGWRVDMSLNLFLLGMVALGMLTVSLIHGWNAVMGLPSRARAWQALKNERAAQALLREATAEFFAGRYGRAARSAQRVIGLEHDLGEIADAHQFTQLARAVAAASLHRLQDRERRDEIVQQAFEAAQATPGQAPVDDGVRLLAAEWALDDRDGARARALLAELPPGTARRTQALRLKLRAARMLGEPTEAMQTARLLAKHQAFTPDAALALLRALALQSLQDARDPDGLRQAWAQLDESARRDARIVAMAARRAAALAQPSDALRWLQPAWDRMADVDDDGRAELALALAEVVRGQGEERVGADWLARVEKAQRQFGRQGEVQAAAGAVMLERRLWGMARRPLELAGADLRLEPEARRHAWLALARMAADEGDTERAAACHRAAAEIG